MKKLLLLSIFCIIPKITLATEVFKSPELSLQIDGYLAGYMIYNDASFDNTNKLDFAGYGEIHFTGEKKISENGVIGAYIELETNPYHTNKTRVFEETYIYLEDFYGRFEMGRAKNISRKMHIYTPDVGLLDIDGSYGLDYLLAPKNFIFIGSTAITTDQESNKLNYISPSWKGFQIGTSYIAGSSDLNGDNTLDYDKFKSGYTLTVKFKNESFGLSTAIAQFDDTNMPLSQTDKRKEYSIGTSYYVQGLQLSAAYKQIDENNILGQKTQNGYAINYGLAYEFGPLEVSLSHHKSNVDGIVANKGKDILNLTLLSGKVNIVDGADFSSSIGRVSYDNKETNSQTGIIVASGFLIKF